MKMMRRNDADDDLDVGVDVRGYLLGDDVAVIDPGFLGVVVGVVDDDCDGMLRSVEEAGAAEKCLLHLEVVVVILIAHLVRRAEEAEGEHREILKREIAAAAAGDVVADYDVVGVAVVGDDVADDHAVVVAFVVVVAFAVAAFVVVAAAVAFAA